MTALLRYGLRSLWLRRTTALATAAGIALVVFVLAASRMLATGLRQTLTSAGSPSKAIVIQADTYAEGRSRLRQSVFGLVAAAPGVRRDVDGTPRAVGEAVTHVYLSRVDAAERHTSVQVRGVTPASLRMRPDVRISAGRAARPGTAEAIVGRGLYGSAEGLLLGSGFEVHKGQRLEIVGVFEAAGSAYESEVWTDLDWLRGALGWNGYLSSVTAELAAPSDFDAFAAALALDKEQGLTIERERAYYERVSNGLSAVIEGLGGVVTFILSFGAMFGAAITMYAAVNQRRRELGVLRALGFARAQVMFVVLAESVALSIAGGATGLLAALATQLIDFSTTNWATGQQIAFRFVPSAGVLGGALLAGAAVGVLGGVFPALEAASSSVVRAVRD